MYTESDFLRAIRMDSGGARIRSLKLSRISMSKWQKLILEFYLDSVVLVLHIEFLCTGGQYGCTVYQSPIEPLRPFAQAVPSPWTEGGGESRVN